MVAFRSLFYPVLSATTWLSWGILSPAPTPSPRLSHSLPRESRCDSCLAGPSLLCVQLAAVCLGNPNWQKALSIHPHQVVTATRNTGIKGRALLVMGCEMTQRLEEPVKSRPRRWERDSTAISPKSEKKKKKTAQQADRLTE